ncbi:MAG: phosphoribosylglycinamide formyltransferase [Prevotellaceae bacterium]|jgi:phosphoribosylglycinamide formyltransferase-1|nr:phosphoribosylglycinamide formyltransferase [Prevotellaceae bacterium]
MSVKIILFASGSGTNVEHIVEYFSSSGTISCLLILSNNPEAGVHRRAKRLKVPSLTFSREEFNDGKKILELLKQFDIDAIILAGFLLKIPQVLIDAYPQKIINIHPALLPKFGGKGMYGARVHEAVKAAGEKETGISIHFVNENYDRGALIFQARCTVESDDTTETIAEKVHQLEYTYYPPVIEKTLHAIFGITTED